MAVEVSNKYREIVYSGGAINRATLTVNDVTIPNSNIKKITISSPIIDNTQEYFYIGTFIAQKVEIEFKNADEIDLNGIVNLSIGTKTDVQEYVDDDGFENIPIGQYYIDTSPEDYYKFSKITCYDKSILFKQKINVADYLSDKITVENPMNVENIELEGNYSNCAIVNKQSTITQAQIEKVEEAFEYTSQSIFAAFDSNIYQEGGMTHYDFKYCLTACKGVVIKNAVAGYNLIVKNFDPNNIVENHIYIGVFSALEAELYIIKDFSGQIDYDYYILPSNLTLYNYFLIDAFPASKSEIYPEGLSKEEVANFICDSIELGYSPSPPNLISAERLLKKITEQVLGQNMLGTYPNINRNATTAYVDPSMTGKAYISYIAEIMGGNAKLGRDGKLYIVPLKQTPQVTINALQSKSWVINSSYKISRVFYEDADNIWENGTTDYNSLNIRLGNVFINGTLSDIQTLIDNLYTELSGFEFYAVKTENYGDVSLDCWDLIHYELGQESYNAFNNNTIVFEMNIASTVDCQIPSKVKQEYVNILSTDNNVLNIMKTEIDQANNRVTQTNSRISSVETELAQNVYTKQQTNELIRSAELGLTNMFTNGGGNNLLTNTAPYRYENNGLESWDGNISGKTETESANKNALLLKSGVASQSVSVPVGTYTLGFKYKRLINGATLTISYNGRTISISSTDVITYNDDTNLTINGNEISSFGEVLGNSFNISFNCSTDDAFEIYELRLIHGSTLLAWTQNQNELKTTSVNIGEGIEIQSDQANTINKLDTYGMVVTNKTTSSEVLRATDEGIVTQDLIATGKSNISGMLIQKVGTNHVFVSGSKES